MHLPTLAHFFAWKSKVLYAPIKRVRWIMCQFNGEVNCSDTKRGIEWNVWLFLYWESIMNFDISDSICKHIIPSINSCHPWQCSSLTIFSGPPLLNVAYCYSQENVPSSVCYAKNKWLELWFCTEEHDKWSVMCTLPSGIFLCYRNSVFIITKCCNENGTTQGKTSLTWSSNLWHFFIAHFCPVVPSLTKMSVCYI